MTKPLFHISTGGRIVSNTTGDDVLTVNLDRLQWADANKVIHACLRALEEEYGKRG